MRRSKLLPLVMSLAMAGGAGAQGPYPNRVGSRPGVDSAQGERVQFMVRDPKGRPVEGASVRVLDPGNEHVLVVEGMTTKEGICLLTNPRPGFITVQVERTGFLVAERRLNSPQGSVEISLELPSAIQGTVLDQQGRPVGPLSLFLIDVAYQEEIDRNILDMDRVERVHVRLPDVQVAKTGKFQFDQVPSGAYRIGISSAAKAPSATMMDRDQVIHVEAGKPVENILVRVISHGTIKGRILFPDGKPTTVKVTPVPRPGQGEGVPPFDKVYAADMTKAATFAQGSEFRFQLEALYPGDYQVYVETEDHGTFLIPMGIQLQPGAVVDTGQTLAPSPVDLSCLVQDKFRRPIKNAALQFFLPDVELPVLEVQSDESGHFSSQHIAPGEYKLVVSHPEFMEYQQKFPLDPTRPRHQVDIELHPGLRLEGVLFGQTGEPLIGTEIMAERKAEVGSKLEGEFKVEATPRSTRTGPDGRFVIGGLTEGNYQIVALARIPVIKHIEVGQGKANLVVLDMTKDGLHDPMMPPGTNLDEPLVRAPETKPKEGSPHHGHDPEH